MAGGRLGLGCAADMDSRCDLVRGGGCYHGGPVLWKMGVLHARYGYRTKASRPASSAVSVGRVGQRWPSAVAAERQASEIAVQPVFRSVGEPSIGSRAESRRSERLAFRLADEPLD